MNERDITKTVFAVSAALLILLVAFSVVCRGAESYTWQKVCPGRGQPCYWVKVPVSQPVMTRVVTKPQTQYGEVDGIVYRVKDDVVEVRWTNSDGTYTWHSKRPCNRSWCTMCPTIEAWLQRVKSHLRSLRNTSGQSMVVGTPVHQKTHAPLTGETLPAEVQQPPAFSDANNGPLSDAMIEQCLDALAITADDVFCDLGCGDGRILIAAVQRFGCRAVGVEIDKDQARKAIENVARAGLTHRIAIIRQDAATFDPRPYGVTIAIAYLFPDTLAKIRHTIEKIPRVATLHSVPGMTPTREHGDIYVYGKPPQREPVKTPKHLLRTFEIVGY